MEEGFTRRLFLPDVRGSRRYLRVTWHKETSTIVWSHWEDEVCIASTPVSLEDASKLVGLIVGALKEVALKRVELPIPGPASAGLLSRLRQRFQPQLAEVVKLHDRLRHDRSTRFTRGA